MLLNTEKFGKLQIRVSQNVQFGSHKKIEWICDCGKEKLIPVRCVLSGHTTSCGQCSIIPAAEIAIKKFGKLRIKTPQDIFPGSDKKIWWVCDCGQEKLINIHSVLSGQSTSCGLCNLIPAAEIIIRKFGKLRIKKSCDILPGSNKKIEWICDCGKEKLIQAYLVISGRSTSCGQCNLITTEKITSRKFNKLQIKEPQDIKPGSNKKILWICDCGQEKLIKICEVISSHITSCGNCGELVKNWYIKNRKQIRLLKCPIDPKNFILGGIIPLKIIKNTIDPFKAICPACKKIYFPRLFNIKRGLSLTCGCSTYHISMPVVQITEYIRSLGFEVQNEYKVNKLAYDIFVPAKNLLIEFQGSKWHSFDFSKERDIKKKQNAINNRYQFMKILEKDWKTKKDEIKNNIRLMLSSW
jgi:hypothetical protein